uniref:Sm domain-containing protein n=1 Tax=Ditylum brightwellii TaxID=49249 RepID=A0A7S4QQ16_9STRA
MKRNGTDDNAEEYVPLWEDVWSSDDEETTPASNVQNSPLRMSPPSQDSNRRGWTYNFTDDGSSSSDESVEYDINATPQQQGYPHHQQGYQPRQLDNQPQQQSDQPQQQQQSDQPQQQSDQPQQQQQKKESILELAKLIDSTVRVKCLGGRELRGTLRGYDELVNLVLDDCEEFLRGEFCI